MFYIPCEMPGAGTTPSDTVTGPKTRTSRQTDTGKSDRWHDQQDDWHDEDWEWPTGGWNQYSEEDWEVWHTRQQGNTEEADRVGRNRRISQQLEKSLEGRRKGEREE